MGSETGAVDFTAIDPMLIPCASRVTLFDGSVIGGEEDCVWEQNKMKEHLGDSFNMLFYHNQ